MNRHVVSKFALVPIVLLATLGYGQDNASRRENGRVIKANVIALDQAFYNNRIGAFQAGGMIFALRNDVVPNDGSGKLTPGNVMLRPDKRARPMVLRMNVGDCMEITFENLLANVPSIAQTPAIPYDPANSKTIPDNSNSSTSQPATRLAGVHVMGMELKEIKADGSWVGANDSSLSAPGDPPRTYRFCAKAEGSYLLYSTGADLGLRLGFGGQLSQGLFGAVTVQPQQAEWYRSQVTRQDLELATYRANALPSNMTLTPEQQTFVSDGKTYKLWKLVTQTNQGPINTQVTQTNLAGDPVDQNGFLKTRDFHPIVNYQAVYPSGFKYPSGTPVPDDTPILAMLNKNGQIVHSDLTAVITGPYAGLFPESDEKTDPAFSKNPTYPERRQPYREFAIHYHDDFVATQAFPEFSDSSLPINFTLNAARDFFAINYGMGAIGPEVWANRVKVGPMYQCDTCKFEEFFLSSWAVGDPAMVVDIPANTGYPKKTGPQATKALYPDDPSNVYHSYLGDHVQFRILHAGTNITHVHHQHAHQWLHSPNSDESDYRDSQMISPGGAYSLDMTYFGSGNLNQTVGDSIFHCHFYPHFAQGMWSMWRVHDVFEEGTLLDKDQRPVLGWNRSLPDGEIKNGTPIPALVPLPEIPMATMPARAQVCAVYAPKDYVQFSGEKCPAQPTPGAPVVGYKALVSEVDLGQKKNPGYPFFVPGVAGQRVTHPPLDFAPEEDKNGKQVVVNGKPQFLDGGLPRLQALQEIGTIYEHHNRWDFSKDNDSLIAVELDETGTNVEKKAMAFHAVRKHPSFTPEGKPGEFILNGQGAKPGAPYADPAVDIHGQPIPGSDCEKGEPGCIRYKAADIQMDVVLNKKGWHFPQQRMLTLWGDVKDNLDGNRRPEPLFFRANSKQVVEYWHTNLVPNYYELDDFQVRTPTDILGQHIHLVKFDVTSSDGAGNGFNYEDGTFSPEEVVEQIHQINKAKGIFTPDASTQVKLEPKEIPYFKTVLPGKFLGAQATIQRWYADPVYDCKQPVTPGKAPLPCEVGNDRTLRTVFTHDHFGPSTHQQVGLYAGLVIEPTGSKWFNSTTGEQLGGRPEGDHDGGPTTYQANIILPNATKSYREFLLEFQDRQLAYFNTSISTPLPYVRYTEPKTNPPGFWGWADPNNSINQPVNPNSNPGPGGPPTPHLITNQFSEGVYSLSYNNEPLEYRLGGSGDQNSLAHIFQSITRSDASLNSQPAKGTPINPANPTGFKFPPPEVGAGALDPYTPLLRAYEGDNIQVRNLVGAHMGPHAFHIHGLNWQFEPSFTNSGFRSTQGMGLSEHYEFLFHLPHTSQPKQADYLYIPTSDANGLQLGNWGLLRGYKDKQPDLVPLSESQKKAFPGSPALPMETAAPTCPAGAPPRTFNVTAVFARDVLDGPLVYNARGRPGTPGEEQIVDWNALIYVRNEDLVNGKLKNTVPREPLILRAAAGDCITIKLTNALPLSAMNAGVAGVAPFGDVTLQTAHEVGLHPQLVSFDVTQSDGVNIGTNPVTTVKPNTTGTFTWYAGRATHDQNGKAVYTPVEFGAVSLAPADPLMQHNFGLVGGLIIEPQGSTWQTDDNSYASATVTLPTKEYFREAVAIIHDDLASLRTTVPAQKPSGPKITIDGALNNGVVQWVRDGVPLSNNSSTTIQAGQTITFGVTSGNHGITFLDKATAEAVFDGVSGGKFQAQPTIGPNAWGTPGQTSGTLATLMVKSNIPSSITKVDFECTIHKTNMAGTFIINKGAVSIQIDGVLANGSVNWVKDGTTLPNNSSIQIQPGQTVTFGVTSGTHGITFLDKATAQAVFDFGSPGLPFKAQPTIGPNAWGTDGVTSGTLATLKVKSNIPSNIKKVDFECTIHKKNMAGSFVFNQGVVSTTIDGALANGSVNWVQNGVTLPNNSAIKIQPDETVTFGVASGTHGITFLDKATAEAIFDFGSPGVPFQPQPTIGPNAWGTPGETSGTLATLKVKHTLPSSIKSVPFECTVHKTNMAGTFLLPGAVVPGPTEPADTQQAINYRTEPIAYRYLASDYMDNTAAKSPLGIARAQSDTLVSADPQTPVFVAEAGKPLRMRMLHPAGLNEQVFVLHGHNWQEEPYTNNSTQIGNNPLSQSTGSRDTFGPNASFDVVLPRAGGIDATKGDYLFRTFIGEDFQNGIWGIVRVGDPGKDVVTVTQFCSAAPATQLTIQGVNTVNPSNHHMAATVTISNGTGTVLGTPKVNPMTGEWSFQGPSAGAPTAITVKSAQGGSTSLARQLCPILQSQPRTPGAPTTPAPVNQEDLFRFRPKPGVSAPQKPAGEPPH
jgi:plastocyanin